MKNKKVNTFKKDLFEYVLNPKRIFFFIFAALVFTGFILINADRMQVMAVTGINETVNFQGKVVNSDGTNVADGEYTFVFRLYNVPTGGSHIWTETQSNVQVTAGIFRVSLGSVSSLSGINFNDDSIYLGINFNSDGEMTPRIRFASVPYAFNAQKVAGLTVTNTTGTLTIPDGETIQFGGSFTTSAQDLTLTLSGTTNVTLPTSGTLSTLSGSEVLTNKSIGSTGLVFSGATTDITTATNEDLTISANGIGTVLVQGQSGGKSAFIVDKTGDGDIMSASSSGITRFTIDNSGNLVLANSESIRNTTDGTITFGRNDAGSVTLTAADNDATAALVIQSGGAAALTLDAGGAAALNLGTTNATSAVLGSSSLASFTVTTSGTGDSAVVLPAQSIGASEILNNTLDFNKFASSMTLDETTTISFSTFNHVYDLTSTGDYLIQDAGNNFVQFLDDGTITLGKSASGGTINIGIGSGADVITIGSDNTSGDTIVIGNDNASSTLALLGGNSWEVTSGGAATFASLQGVGLSDCDAATDKLLWNDATGTFSCGTDMGSNLQVVNFTDTTTEVATFTTAMDIWDGTYPNITPGSTSSKILISVNIRGTSDDANDHNPVFVIRREIGSNPVCTGGSPSTQVGGEFVGGFLTTTSQDWGATVTTSDAPASTGNVRYTVCTTTTGLDDANTDEVRIVLTEIGSSSAGGGGNVSVRESDGSPSITSASTIEFGPASSSSDEFVVTDEGSGIARIRLGTQVGLLNEAETVTGGWTFDTGNTTFTTAIVANGGLTTASNGNLTFTPNGTGDVIFNLDHDTGVSIGSSSNTPAPLSVFGGIGGNAAFVLNQLNEGDIFAASSSGVTRFVVDNLGNVDIAGGINLSTEDINFSSTGSLIFNGGTISDTSAEVNIDDDLIVSGNIVLTGTTGLNLSGSGADLFFSNSESLGNDTDGTLTFGRNDAGTVTLTAKDNDAIAALSILSGGAAALTLDTGGSANLGIGTTNADVITIGNTSSTTTLNLTKGASGNIVLTGFNCSTLTNGGVLTTDASGNIECQNDDGGAATATYWDSSLGALYPNNSTYDVLFGGTSTASAKFGFLNINNGGTPTATISATATGNALILDANGNIRTTQNQRLTLGGGDSGEIYTASLLKIDSTLGIRGGGLSDCDNPTTSKLLWDDTTNRFSCGTDQGGGGGSSITVRESDSSPAVSAVAVLEFGPGTTSSDEFIVTDEGSGIARVRIGNQVGLLNEAETVTGGWTFDTGNTTFTTAVNLNGGLTTSTTDQNLAFSANGAGDFVFTIDSNTNVLLTGGSDGSDAFVISAGDILLSDGDFDLSGGDFNINLDTSDTANLTKTGASAGDVFNISASSVNSINGLQIDLTSTSDSAADTYNGLKISWTESSDADIVNAINIPNTTSTTSTATGIVIGTGWDTGILINSGGVSIVAGGLTVSAGGVAVNGGDITSTQSTLTLDAAGTVQISDNLTVTGTTGLTLTGSGADIIFANNESIRNDTDGTFTLARNDAGTVTINALDNDSTAALTITSGGAATLTLDAGGAAGVSIGTTNANTITLGNTASGMSVSIDSGSGGINIGDNATTKSIEIGGVDNNGSDTIRIATNATSADSINIGNANSSTTIALTGGTAWSVTSAGAATFTTLSGAGLSSCSGSTNKLVWSGGSFSCDTDNTFAQSKTFSDTTNDTSVSWTTATDVWDGTQPNMTITNTNNRILVSFTANIVTDDANDEQAALQIRRSIGSSATCSSTAVGESILGTFLTTANQEQSLSGTFLDTGSFTASNVANYTICTGGHSNALDDGTVLSLTMTLVEVGPAGADLAEVYYSEESILPGEVVALDNTAVKVRKTSKPYDSSAIGIVSTQPGLVLGTSENHPGKPVIVALSGRVPVKVTTENGPIKVGDRLTSSSIPGVAQKATKAGVTIGLAMEDYEGEGVGQILAFVTNTYSQGIQHAQLLEGLSEDNYSSIEKKRIDLEVLSDLIKTGTPSSQITTDVLVAGVKVISNEISAKNLNVSGLSILDGDQMSIDLGADGELVIKNDKSETKVRFDTKGNAYFAGTLMADNIVTNKINGLEVLVSEIVATDNATLAFDKRLLEIKKEQENLSYQMASISAMLSKIGQINILSGNDNIFLTSIDNLSVSGTTTLSELSVLENLTVGSGSIITFSEGAVNSIGSDLSVQNLKQGAVDFLAGSIRFETDGKAVFAEDAEFRKNVAVAGVLTAKTVSVTDLLLGQGDTVELSDDEVEATAAAGLVTLKQNRTKVRINNPLVKEKSFIFITPKTKTSRTLFLLEQHEAKEDQKAHFIVGIDRESNEDIKFNYLIVN